MCLTWEPGYDFPILVIDLSLAATIPLGRWTSTIVSPPRPANKRSLVTMPSCSFDFESISQIL